MANINTAKPVASPYVNAVCVAVEDLGVMKTKYGTKPMVKFVFETNEVNEYSTKRRLTRLFHKHFHPMSTLSVTAKTWCNRDLAAEEENIGAVDLQSFVESSAQLKLTPGALIDGRRYFNIAEILPRKAEKPEANSQPEETK